MTLCGLFSVGPMAITDGATRIDSRTAFRIEVPTPAILRGCYG